LAVAAFSRYTAASGPPEPDTLARLLSIDQLARARALGAAMRLGCDLSGRSPVLLAGSTVAAERGELVLTVRTSSADMLLGEQINKRAGQLGAALGLPVKIRQR
jgi:exopolyphosphatase/guanosine-5'-triphosphate,3'-diphosphate pyrophosphatase